MRNIEAITAAVVSVAEEWQLKRAVAIPGVNPADSANELMVMLAPMVEAEDLPSDRAVGVILAASRFASSQT